jgi:hypothetical protein
MIINEGRQAFETLIHIKQIINKDRKGENEVMKKNIKLRNKIIKGDRVN